MSTPAGTRVLAAARRLLDFAQEADAEHSITLAFGALAARIDDPKDFREAIWTLTSAMAGLSFDLEISREQFLVYAGEAFDFAVRDAEEAPHG